MTMTVIIKPQKSCQIVNVHILSSVKLLVLTYNYLK